MSTANENQPLKGDAFPDFLRIGPYTIDVRKIAALMPSPPDAGRGKFDLYVVGVQGSLRLDNAVADALLAWLDGRYGIVPINRGTWPTGEASVKTDVPLTHRA